MARTATDQSTHTNDIYLTGLGKRNYFDMRAFYYVTSRMPITTAMLKSSKQPSIRAPTITMSIRSRYHGGELSANVNFTHLSRDQACVLDNANNLGDPA